MSPRDSSVKYQGEVQPISNCGDQFRPNILRTEPFGHAGSDMMFISSYSNFLCEIIDKFQNKGTAHSIPDTQR